ncbi:hypothetical protein AHAS_Ahas15G0245600 [Arachis hypogaea]
MERQLQMHKLPPNLRKLVNEHIESRGWSFLERDLVEANKPWALEFYANYHNTNLKSLLLRGKQIPITKAAIADILKIPPKLKGWSAFAKAQADCKLDTLFWDKVLEKIAIPGSTWVRSTEQVPKPIELHVRQLTQEARIWQQLLNTYAIPSIHETTITWELAVLV